MARMRNTWAAAIARLEAEIEEKGRRILELEEEVRRLREEVAASAREVKE